MTTPLSANNLGQVVHTQVPLSTSSIIWYRSRGGWEGNRRYGIALAMHHRLQWFIHLWADGLDREMSTPPMLSCGVWPIYLFTLPSVMWHCWLGSRKSNWSEKNRLMRCWCGCMSGVRCKWSAYGLADATAVPKLIISHFIKVWMDTFLLSGWLGCLKRGC